jgi:phage tail sheath gpL-like
LAISFKQIPANNRVPFVFVEIDNSNSARGPVQLAYTALLIGQRLAGGTQPANTVERVTSAAQAATKAGRGSMLHRQAIAWFLNDTTTEMYLGALDDDAAGVAATGDVLFAGPATGSGTIVAYLGGNRVTIGVTADDTAAEIATAAVAAINLKLDLPVTAAVDGVEDAKINITFRHKGEAGNGYAISFNYYDGEELPAGVTTTITAMTGGTSNPDPSDLITALGDDWYHIISHPYTDGNSLTDIEAEMASRFGPLRMIPGVAISATAGDLSTAGTLGDSRNSPHSSIMATNQSPSPVFEYAAAVAAVAAFYGQIDPARPFQTLALAGILAPAKTIQWTLQERNLLLYDNISTTRVDSGGNVLIERLVTTYSENAAGAPDVSYLDVNTLLTLMFLRYDFRAYIMNKYPRHKLSNDGVRVGPGQAVITPKLGKAEAVVKFRQWETLGLVENVEQFKNDLIVERNAADPNRLDFFLPPDLINQFRVAGVQIAFLLQGENS